MHFENEKIIDFLLKALNGDILSCVSEDGWSPMQLCLERENWKLLSKLCDFASKEQMEMQTLKGSFPHTLFEKGPFNLIKDLVLRGKLDPFVINQNEIPAHSLCKKEELKEILTFVQLPEEPVNLVSEAKMRSQKLVWFESWKNVFLKLNFETFNLEVYSREEEINFRPKHIFSLKNISDF